MTDINLDELQSKYASMPQEQLEMEAIIIAQTLRDRQLQENTPNPSEEGSKNPEEELSYSQVSDIPGYAEGWDDGFCYRRAETEEKKQYWHTRIQTTSTRYKLRDAHYKTHWQTNFKNGVDVGSRNTFPW